jgi:GNAT superfamily N-acetyltransferase
MVVAETARGTGIGRAVLDAAVALARDQGARTMWAEARSSALGFYASAGWTVVGDEWIKPGVGPHRYIRLDIV